MAHLPAPNLSKKKQLGDGGVAIKNCKKEKKDGNKMKLLTSIFVLLAQAQDGSDRKWISLWRDLLVKKKYFLFLFEPEKSAKKSYEAYEYVPDDYYSLDQQLATLNVDSNQAGFGGEVDTAELFPSEVERSADVSFIFRKRIWIFILA